MMTQLTVLTKHTQLTVLTKHSGNIYLTADCTTRDGHMYIITCFDSHSDIINYMLHLSHMNACTHMYTCTHMHIHAQTHTYQPRTNYRHMNKQIHLWTPHNSHKANGCWTSSKPWQSCEGETHFTRCQVNTCSWHMSTWRLKSTGGNEVEWTLQQWSRNDRNGIPSNRQSMQTFIFTACANAMSQEHWEKMKLNELRSRNEKNWIPSSKQNMQI